MQNLKTGDYNLEYILVYSPVWAGAYLVTFTAFYVPAKVTVKCMGQNHDITIFLSSPQRLMEGFLAYNIIQYSL